jgi:hypothetical protein
VARVDNHHAERLRYAGSDRRAHCEGEQYTSRPNPNACAFPRPCKTGRHDDGI